MIKARLALVASTVGVALAVGLPQLAQAAGRFGRY